MTTDVSDVRCPLCGRWLFETPTPNIKLRTICRGTKDCRRHTIIVAITRGVLNVWAVPR